jgi:hypothetical protein
LVATIQPVRTPSAVATSMRSSTLWTAQPIACTCLTCSGCTAIAPLAKIASNAARTASGPTTRAPPGWTQTTSSSSAQTAIRRSMSPSRRAS